MSTRLISFSEVSTLLRCPAQWDFRYGSTLAGTSLKEKHVAPRLSAGRAWGAAIAAWHCNTGHLDAGLQAIEAMDESLAEDAEQMIEFGVWDEEAHHQVREHLLRLLVHELDVVEQIPMHSVEDELRVAIPSRTGQRSSNRYAFHGFIDAYETDQDGATWLNEFKLRGSLHPVELIQRSRQLRWYAWAFQRQYGLAVAGVYVNERLDEPPKLPRLVKTGRKDGSLRPSDAIDQMTTADAYQDVCAEYDREPNQATVAALAARRWGQRVPIIFRPGELEEAGHELVGAARLIAEHESGVYPIRNPSRATCGYCAFREICEDPSNGHVEALFARVPPKAEREPLPEGVASG